MSARAGGASLWLAVLGRAGGSLAPPLGVQPAAIPKAARWRRLLMGDAAAFVTLAKSRTIGLLLAFIEQSEVIENILAHLGLWPTPAHSPPESM